MSKKLKEFQKILSTKEDLHEDLVPYLEDIGKGSFPMLRHPLVFSVPHFEQLNSLTNKRYLYIKERVRVHFDKKEFSEYVFFHERPYRLQAFIDCHKLLPDMQYWKLLSEIWIDSENIWQNLPTWKKLLKSKRKHKHFFMNKYEINFLKKMPDTITVYRGCTSGLNEGGLSYTTLESKAIWFANRFGESKGKSKVIERQVQKSEVFAYINGRKENEIILI